mgnify:FL=1
MIIVDIETTGLNPYKHSICEIGAIKFEDPSKFFHKFVRIDNNNEIDQKSLEINGQTEKSVRDHNRQSQISVLKDFFEWIKNQKDFYVAGENVGIFDLMWIKSKAEIYNLTYPFQYRSFDLNTAATMKYEETHGKLPIVDGKNQMSLDSIIEFVGLKYERKIHNALEDCKLEAEAISRIRQGKNLFQEYSQFPIPDYLKR